MISVRVVISRAEYAFFCALVLAASLMSSAAIAFPELIDSNLGGEIWLDRDDAIALSFDRRPTRLEGRIVVFVGDMDVTALTVWSGTELRYEPIPVRLPRGRQTVVVYVVRDERWAEIASLPLQVLGRLGVREANIDLRADISFDAQLDEHHSGDATPPEDERYAEVNGSAGLSTLTNFGTTQITSEWTTVFSSSRSDALRFAEEGSDASRIDLADYRVELRRGGTQVQVGHIGFGDHRHLISNLQRRGIRLRQTIGSWTDVSATLLSGRRIVGAENFTGIQDADALLAALTIGLVPIDRDALRVRIETSALWSSVEETKSDFNSGQVRDSESSRGVGIVLSGDAWAERVRYSGSWARSSFKNKPDTELFLGLDVQSAKRETSDAYYTDLEISVLRDHPIFEDHRVSATLTAGFEQVDPFYRSLGAFAFADQRQYRLGGSIDLAGIAMQLDHAWLRDNLDRVAGVLVTRTRDLSFNFVLPIANFVPEHTSVTLRTLIPSFNYSLRRTDQKASNGGTVFSANAIPSQLSTTHTVRADWFLEDWGLDYSFSQSFQNNRQTGRKQADLRSRIHILSVSFRPLEELALRAGTSFTRQRDFESGLSASNHAVDAGVTWRFWPGWTISADASYSMDTDSRDTFESNFSSVNARLVREFELAIPKLEKRRGRVFLAFNRQSNEFQANLANVDTRAETWVLTAGASLSLF